MWLPPVLSSEPAVTRNGPSCSSSLAARITRPGEAPTGSWQACRRICAAEAACVGSFADPRGRLILWPETCKARSVS